MERLTTASDYDREQAQAHARVIAFGALVTGFAMTSAVIIGGSGGYGAIDFWFASFVGGVFWGVMYGLVYLVSLPSSDSYQDDDTPQPTPLPPRAMPSLPQVNQEVRHEFTAVWNGRLQVGSRLEPLPENVYEEDLLKIHAARLRGELDTVSERGLERIDISRWADNRMRVKNLIDFLNQAGAIDQEGNWTDAGVTAFPSPAAIVA